MTEKLTHRPVEINGFTFNKRDIGYLQEFNNAFDKNSIYLDWNTKNKLILHLKEIDLHKLKQLCAVLLETSNNSVFNAIPLAVEKIGSYGLKGNKRDYVGYNKERKTKNRKEKEQARTQFYYAQENEFSKEINPLPTEFENMIITAGSLGVLRNMPDNCIDLVLTSPPYNFGLDYELSQDAHYWRDYFDQLFQVFKECIRVVKYGGRIIINVQPLFSDYIPSHHIISNFFINQKMIWKGEILWEKNHYNCKYTSWGSWKSPSSPYLKYTWEFIEIFCKGELKKSGKSENIDITADEFKQWVMAKWSIIPERKMKECGHPAMFPEELVRRVLKLFSYRNDVVLDPFNGAGTTTVVADTLGRRYCGIDISPQYCRIARRRLKEVNLNEKLP